MPKKTIYTQDQQNAMYLLSDAYYLRTKKNSNSWSAKYTRWAEKLLLNIVDKPIKTLIVVTGAIAGGVILLPAAAVPFAFYSVLGFLASIGAAEFNVRREARKDLEKDAQSGALAPQYDQALDNVWSGIKLSAKLGEAILRDMSPSAAPSTPKTINTPAPKS